MSRDIIFIAFKDSRYESVMASAACREYIFKIVTWFECAVLLSFDAEDFLFVR